MPSFEFNRSYRVVVDTDPTTSYTTVTPRITMNYRFNGNGQPYPYYSILLMMFQEGYCVGGRGDLNQLGRVRSLYPTLHTVYPLLVFEPTRKIIHVYESVNYAALWSSAQDITADEIAAGKLITAKRTEIEIPLTPKHKFIVTREGIRFGTRKIPFKIIEQLTAAKDELYK